MIMTLRLQPSHSHNNLHFHSFIFESPDFRVSSAMDFDSAATRSRSSLNHEIFRSWNGKQIYLKDDAAPVEYGFRSSPQLSPRSYRSNYRSLSPPAKALAVATGQKELMEIVNNMPECCYELSLRDLVEQPMVLGGREETLTDDVRVFDLRGDREVFARENRRSKKESRPPSAFMENNGGLYLKMGLPKSIGAKTTATRKKKIDSGLNMSAKVSPKPHQLSENVVNNGNIKSNSCSSSGSTKNRTKATDRNESGGCWSCIYPKYNERDE